MDKDFFSSGTPSPFLSVSLHKSGQRPGKDHFHWKERRLQHL
jgi:hypothetical protein